MQVTTLSIQALVTVAAVLLAKDAALGQAITPVNSAPNPYRAIENWARLPDGRVWGSTNAVDIDRDGVSVWVAERCGSFAPPSMMKPGLPFACSDSALPPILKFDASGSLVKSFGVGTLVLPHCLHIDHEGNVWVADGLGKDGKGHQVIKFSPDGKVIKTWGKKGSGPGEMNIPHALAMDSRGRLFLADRGNNRIQIFDQEGNYLDQWFQFSRPSGVFIDRNDIIYVADSESESVAKDHDGWKRGIRIGRVGDGVVTAFIPDPVEKATTTSAAEGVAADGQGNIYGPEVGPKRLMRYVKQ